VTHELKTVSFTFPAADFGDLAGTKEVLECHWNGWDDELLKRAACWHTIDPESRACIRCGATEKWIANADLSPADQASAARLLRLRQFFRTVDVPPPYGDFYDEEPEQLESVPIRVILAPIAKLLPAPGTSTPDGGVPSLVDVEWQKLPDPPMADQIQEHMAAYAMSSKHVDLIEVTPEQHERFKRRVPAMIDDARAANVVNKNTPEDPRSVGRALDRLIHSLTHPDVGGEAIAKAMNDLEAAFEARHPEPLKAVLGRHLDQLKAERLQAKLQKAMTANLPDPAATVWQMPYEQAKPNHCCPHCGQDANCQCEHPQPPSPWE
jgi:hypothetical protein